MASVQNQIDSNAAYAKKLQEEEMNFRFKPDFDTQGNSNLAKRIGIAESTGASEEDIQVILAGHDYRRSSALKPKVQSQAVVSSGTPSRSNVSSSNRSRSNVSTVENLVPLGSLLNSELKSSMTKALLPTDSK